MPNNDPAIWICPALGALAFFWLIVQGIWDRLVSKRQEKYRTASELESSARAQLQELEERQKRFDEESALVTRTLEGQRSALIKEHRQMRDEIEHLATEKGKGFPWLASAYADYFYLKDLRVAKELQTKRHPAVKASTDVREIAAKRREAERSSRIARYQLEYYESIFPWLTEFKELEGEDFDLIRREEGKPRESDGDDPALMFLAPGEYERLTNTQKFQLALDRYWNSRKTKWQIGREYERYVGYLYETQGYNVMFHGIIKGFDDLGRDLIATKGREVHIIQCKNWSQQKLIHEKHIFQLYGSVIEYWLSNNEAKHSAQRPLFEEVISDGKVVPVFYTSTQLSERARAFASALHVKVVENKPLVRWPLIKCNCNNGIRIYHLPFDQQYDRTKILDPRTEMYVSTVKEAEDHNYRRAFRWRGQH